MIQCDTTDLQRHTGGLASYSFPQAKSLNNHVIGDFPLTTLAQFPAGLPWSIALGVETRRDLTRRGLARRAVRLLA